MTRCPLSGIGYAAGGFPKGADSKALLQQVRGGVLAATLTNGVSEDLVAAAKRP